LLCKSLIAFEPIKIVLSQGLDTVLKSKKSKQLLYAPVLSCTIDHIMGVTETKRGGRYILPFLRLMSSDLVIDEVDDFDGRDLIAIGRLIHHAGMLGRKVMISSATIAPDLALGFFNAYQAEIKLGHITTVWIFYFLKQCLNPETKHH
jgi:CRISPR/Cas system-associated endonuclease/helicase Cas3